MYDDGRLAIACHRLPGMSMEDVYVLFDGVKGALIELLEGGIENGVASGTSLDVLASNLSVMGLDELASIIRQVHEKISEGNGVFFTPAGKNEVASLILKAITVARLFEQVMSVESARQDLAGGDDEP